MWHTALYVPASQYRLVHQTKIFICFEQLLHSKLPPCGVRTTGCWHRQNKWRWRVYKHLFRTYSVSMQWKAQWGHKNVRNALCMGRIPAFTGSLPPDTAGESCNSVSLEPCTVWSQTASWRRWDLCWDSQGRCDFVDRSEEGFLGGDNSMSKVSEVREQAWWDNTMTASFSGMSNWAKKGTRLDKYIGAKL